MSYHGVHFLVKKLGLEFSVDGDLVLFFILGFPEYGVEVFPSQNYAY